MTEAPKRRGRAWKVLAVVVGVILLCVAALLVWVESASRRKLSAIDALARVMATEWRARDTRRPVLQGAAEAGNAWDDYKSSFAELRKSKNVGKLGKLVTRDPAIPAEVGPETLAENRKTLEFLRQGAIRGSSRYPYEWEQGAGSMAIPPLSSTQNLASLAVLEARALADEGKPREAVSVLLDGCQLGRDIGDDGMLISEMIGQAILQQILGEASELLTAGKLDGAALRDLDSGLAALDGSFPEHARTLTNESMLIGLGLTQEAATASWGAERLLYTNTGEQTIRMLARASKAESLPWPELQKELKAIDQEARSAWNPIIRTMVPGLINNSRVGRERRVHLRLLRVAARFKTTGEVLDLDDPFGGKLRTTLAGDALKIWSVGMDGVDDGGTGSWKIGGKDIVLDVKK